MIRKILLSLNALILAILLTITPVHRAQAALPLVLPVGGAVAAGVYVTTALAVGGLATVVGLEYGDEINAHAHRVWDSTTQAVNDSVNWSMQQWDTLQNGAMPIGNVLYDHLGAQIGDLVGSILAEYAMERGFQLKATTFNVLQEGISTSNNTASALSAGTINTYAVLVTDGTVASTPYNIYVEAKWNGIILNNSKVIPYTTYNQETAKALLKGVTSLPQLVSVFNAIAAGSSYQLKLRSSDTQYEEQYAQGVSSTRETWQDMKDAGLVLPNTGVTTYTGDTLVNYNAQTDTWQGIDGNVYNPSDLTWKFPTVRTRTGTADIPAGTYVDSPALTGNPAIDEALINNPAIPKTTTNVTTGTTYANPDIATDTPVETPGLNPPKNPSKTISMVPLIIAGETLTTKFPFSLPWDMIRQLSVFDVEPQAPVFEVDIQNYLTFPELGISIPFKMDIDLTFLDPVAAIARWGTIIAFDIALILMLRRLLPE